MISRVINSVFAVGIAATFFVSCSEKKEDPKSYFDSVIRKTDSVVVVFNKFIDGSTYFVPDSLNKALGRIDVAVKEQGSKIANMQDYEGDASLRMAAITFVNQLNEVSNSEFKQMVKLSEVSDTLNEQVKGDKIDSLASVMGLKVNMASKPFIKAQTEFASKFKIKLNFDYEIAPVMKKEIDTTVLVK